MKAAILAVALLILVCPTGMLAQQTDAGTDKEPAKEPAPPLFPTHRRGLYRIGEGPPRLDATPQSPPLSIDDPGVPERGEFEINFSSLGDLSKTVDELDLFQVDANYGIVSKLAGHEVPTQVKIEFPIGAVREDGQSFVAGIGPLTAGLKFNFYDDENTGLSLSFYPQLEWTAPGTRAVEKGLAEPGQTVILPLLVAKELSQLTVVVNAGVRFPIHDPERATIGSVLVGAGRAITRHFVLIAEAHFESAFAGGRDRLAALNVGAMRSVGERLVVYANAGRSLFADDGVSHTFVGFGLKVLTDSNKK